MSDIPDIDIPIGVEVLFKSCFGDCKSLYRVTFAYGSCLKRIEKDALSYTGLKEIEIHVDAEVLCENCFS